MTGCRHNAKNTLVKNYLHLAEKHGARVLPLTTVTRISPRGGAGTPSTSATPRPSSAAGRPRRVLTADQVVLAASALGTQRLLHWMKHEGHLPRLSDRLGELTRTNSESVIGAIAPDTSVDYTQGVAITSSFHPDAHTHIEPVRYGKGSNAMSLMQTVLTDEEDDKPRWRTWLRELWREKGRVLDLYDVRHWSERTVIALVMQSRDNSITTFLRRNRAGRWGSRRDRAMASPTPPGSRPATRPRAGWPS